MRTISKTIYICKFNELSETAKQRAKDEHASAMGYSWSTEALESIKALADKFGARVSDWSIDWFANSHSSMRFDCPELDREEIAEVLETLGDYNHETLAGHGDCVLTGYTSDEDAIDGLRREFHAGESDIETLLQAAFDSWLEACQSDCEYQYSDESFADTCEANNYEFHNDGSFHS